MVYWAQRIVLMLPIAFLLCNSCTQPAKEQLPYYNTPDFTPEFNPGNAAHTIGDFSFTDQYGQTIGSNDVKGKIHVANFFFTRCGSICPPMMDNMQTVQQNFSTDTCLVILSFSVTPWSDSVPRLKEYADGRGIKSSNWHLLTGSKSAIYTLARKSYFAEESFGFNRDSTEFLHTEHFLLVDKQQRIRGIYNGTLRLEVEQLIKDIAILKQED